MSMLSIALTGLNAAQAGLTTTSHNITNANVEGFSRQEAIQSTNFANSTGSGFFGQGTKTDTVRRVYSQFLQNQVLSASSAKNMWETYSREVAQIDNLVSDPNVDLSNGLNTFFSGIQSVSKTPSSIPSRQDMLSSSETLVSNFRSLYNRFEEIRSGTEQQITDSVAAINSLSAQIQDLNQRIAISEASGNGEPNDLLDQRDQLVNDLNEQVKVSVVISDDGKYNVFIGNGQPLVVGNSMYELSAQPSMDDPEELAVGTVLSKNPTTIQEIPMSLLSGGILGGLLNFRSESLNSAENALGRIALGLTMEFNAQHALGQDLNGNLGQNYFVPLTVDTAKLLNSVTGVVSGANVAVTVSDVGKVTTSDYVLSFDGTDYTLTRKSDGVEAYKGAGPITGIDGLDIDAASLTTMNTGDRVLIQPTRNAAANIALAISNTRQIAAACPVTIAAPLASAPNTGTGTLDPNTLTVNSVASGIPLAGDIVLSFDSATNLFNVSGAVSGSIPYDPALDSMGLTVDLRNIDPSVDISFRLAGVPANGDSFTISNNTSGVSDGRNALILGNLQTKKILEGDGASLEYAYAQMVSEVGTQAHTANLSYKAQNTLLSDAESKMSSVSGVILDEEAANLLRYQQAYQASAKALSIASQLFDQILSLGG